MANFRLARYVIALASVIGMPITNAQRLGNCPVFPLDNVWNAKVDKLPVHPRSDAYVGKIGLTRLAHADFGSGTWAGAPIGIPFVTVPGNQTRVPISFQYS